MNMNKFYSGSISVSEGVNQSVLLFNLPEDSITSANVCFKRGKSENEPKETTRPRVKSKEICIWLSGNTNCGSQLRFGPVYVFVKR